MLPSLLSPTDRFRYLNRLASEHILGWCVYYG